MEISYFYIVPKLLQQNCSNFITFNLGIMILEEGHNSTSCDKCLR